MKKYVNGKYIELTAEEITALEEAQARFEAEEATRPLTAEERLAELEAALQLLISGAVE